MISIRPLLLSDCATLAEAHINNLSTPLKGGAGIELLTVYYQAFAAQNGGTGFVATDDGDFLGYICGVWDRHAIKRFLLKQSPRLVFPAFRHSLHVPRYVFTLLRRFFSTHTTHSLIIEGYELRPIVVLQQHRGRGVADTLVRRLLLDAQGRGFGHISLLTELHNSAAARFYSRFGFRCEHTIHTHDATLQLFRYYFSGEHAESK